MALTKLVNPDNWRRYEALNVNDEEHKLLNFFDKIWNVDFIGISRRIGSVLYNATRESSKFE